MAWVGLGWAALAASSPCPGPLPPVPQASPQVLGDGTAGSVSQAQLQAALDAGGFITFDVGPGPETITVTSELEVSRETVIDGGGVVTLSGGGSNRVLLITNPGNAVYTLTLQNLTIADGATPSGSGAGVYKPSGGPWQAVSLVAIRTTFRDNVAVTVAQDDGGGAVYATGMRDVILSECDFLDNRGSNGGAVYSLGSETLTILHSTFERNHATGFMANPGLGGNGGAIGVDGADRIVDVCRSRFVDNRCNAHGCAFFTVMYDGSSLTAFEETTFEGNVNPTADDHTGGAYIQGGPFAIRRSIFEGNEAEAVGALFLGPGATGEIVNTTFYGNNARQGLAGAISINTSEPVAITNATIAGNTAPGAVAFAAGIRVDAVNQVVMTNTILADNVGGNVYNPWNILNPVGDGGGNLQFPQLRPNGWSEVAATASVVWADPQLAPPADNGGPTRTMALPVASPAVGGGVAAGAPATDQRNVRRDASPEVGAFERPEIFADGFESGDVTAWQTAP